MFWIVLVLVAAAVALFVAGRALKQRRLAEVEWRRRAGAASTRAFEIRTKLTEGLAYRCRSARRRENSAAAPLDDQRLLNLWDELHGRYQLLRAELTELEGSAPSQDLGDLTRNVHLRLNALQDEIDQYSHSADAYLRVAERHRDAPPLGSSELSNELDVACNSLVESENRCRVRREDLDDVLGAFRAVTPAEPVLV